MYIIYIYIIIQIYENEVLNVLKQYHAFCCSLQCGVGARSRARYIPLPPKFGFNVCFLPLPVGVRDMVHVSEKYHTLVKSCARWGDGGWGGLKTSIRLAHLLTL